MPCEHTHQNAVTHYDFSSAGRAAEGLYLARSNIELATRATRGIIHTFEAKSIPVAFLHVHLHGGNPFDELADAFAKAAAKGDYFAGLPTGVPTEFYIAEHPLTDCMWLIDTTSNVKAAYGFVRCQATPHGRRYGFMLRLRQQPYTELSKVHLLF